MAHVTTSHWSMRVIDVERFLVWFWADRQKQTKKTGWKEKARKKWYLGSHMISHQKKKQVLYHGNEEAKILKVMLNHMQLAVLNSSCPVTQQAGYWRDPYWNGCELTIDCQWVVAADVLTVSEFPAHSLACTVVKSQVLKLTVWASQWVSWRPEASEFLESSFASP